MAATSKLSLLQHKASEALKFLNSTNQDKPYVDVPRYVQDIFSYSEGLMHEDLQAWFTNTKPTIQSLRYTKITSLTPSEEMLSTLRVMFHSLLVNPKYIVFFAFLEDAIGIDANTAKATLAAHQDITAIDSWLQRLFEGCSEAVTISRLELMADLAAQKSETDRLTLLTPTRIPSTLSEIAKQCAAAIHEVRPVKAMLEKFAGVQEAPVPRASASLRQGLQLNDEPTVYTSAAEGDVVHRGAAAQAPPPRKRRAPEMEDLSESGSSANDANYLDDVADDEDGLPKMLDYAVKSRLANIAEPGIPILASIALAPHEHMGAKLVPGLRPVTRQRTLKAWVGITSTEQLADAVQAVIDMVARHKHKRVQVAHVIGVQKALLTMYKIADRTLPMRVLRSEFGTLAEVTYFRTEEVVKQANMSRLLATMLSQDKAGVATTPTAGTSTIKPAAPQKIGTITSAKFRTTMLRFIVAPDQACGTCLTLKHGWWNCPLTAKRVETMFKEGTWGVKLSDTQLATVREAALKSVQKAYATATPTWAKVEKQAEDIPTSRITRSRMDALLAAIGARSEAGQDEGDKVDA